MSLLCNPRFAQWIQTDRDGRKRHREDHIKTQNKSTMNFLGCSLCSRTRQQPSSVFWTTFPRLMQNEKCLVYLDDIGFSLSLQEHREMLNFEVYFQGLLGFYWLCEITKPFTSGYYGNLVVYKSKELLIPVWYE